MLSPIFLVSNLFLFSSLLAVWDQSHNLLLVLSFSPLLAIVSLLFIPVDDFRSLKNVALSQAFIIFIFTVFIFFQFDNRIGGFQFEVYYSWIPVLGLTFHLGIDGISMVLLLLTVFLIPLCMLSNWLISYTYIRQFFILLFTVEFFLIQVFTVLDLLLFYFFFEAVLIPMFLLIGLFGSRFRRVYASYKFFLYTLFGSLFMLLAILYIYLHIGSLDFYDLYLAQMVFDSSTQKILWLCFFFSLAAKIPMVPVHVWLPEAHVEAPTSGSVLLAGILLKLGGYGFLRFLIPLFPTTSLFFQSFVYTLSVLAIIYISLVTIRQVDLKKIIAYSSVAHMGLVTLGIFSGTVEGIAGATFLMLSHGVVSSALFICIGFLYDRFGTRLLPYYGGLVFYMPMFSFFLFVFILANMAVPGTASFVAEILVLTGLFGSNTFVAFLAGLGIVFGAVYSIWLYNRLCFGDFPVNFVSTLPGSKPIVSQDINGREFLVLFILFILTIFLGILPNFFLSSIEITTIAFLRNFF